MKKLKAQYALQEIQEVVSREDGRALTFAAESMGLSRAEALGVVLSLNWPHVLQEHDDARGQYALARRLSCAMH